MWGSLDIISCPPKFCFEGNSCFVWNSYFEVMWMVIKCNLRVIFAEREIRQTEFAQRIGIGRATLSQLVNNKSLPTLEVAYRIAKELDLNVMEIWVVIEA
jgi:putative transcriptional regulator